MLLASSTSWYTQPESPHFMFKAMPRFSSHGNSLLWWICSTMNNSWAPRTWTLRFFQWKGQLKNMWIELPGSMERHPFFLGSCVAGCCWMLLDVAGSCWLLLPCSVLLAQVGLDPCAKALPKATGLKTAFFTPVHCQEKQIEACHQMWL